MFNLLDILQSQAGPGMQAIGQQFGLSPDQSRRAMEALLPALASGLQHSAASDPMGFGRLLGSVGMASYLDPRSSTSQPDILGQLFGSPMLSQAVLQQASLASGVGAQALRQVLPVMAGMVVAGIVHVLLNQGQQPAVPQTPAPAPEPGFPAARFWNDWVNTCLGSTEPSEPEPRPRAAMSAPWRTSASAASHTSVQTSPTASPEPPDDKRDEPDKPILDEVPFEVLQQMFQTGVQVQEQNAKAMQTLFAAFWSALPQDVAARTNASKTSAKDVAPEDAAPPRSRRPSKSRKPKAAAAGKRPARTKKDAGSKGSG